MEHPWCESCALLPELSIKGVAVVACGLAYLLRSGTGDGDRPEGRMLLLCSF